MKKENKVFAQYNPSQGPKNRILILEKESSDSLILLHSQYKDKEIQGHNSVEDYKRWISVVEILEKRGKVKNAKDILSNLKSKIKKPSFFSSLFSKKAS